MLAFSAVSVEDGPYLFPDLPGASEADERAAIEAGRIQATRVDYRGKRL
jgi:hypothetical protein